MWNLNEIKYTNCLVQHPTHTKCSYGNSYHFARYSYRVAQTSYIHFLSFFFLKKKKRHCSISLNFKFWDNLTFSEKLQVQRPFLPWNICKAAVDLIPPSLLNIIAHVDSEAFPYNSSANSKIRKLALVHWDLVLKLQ